MKILVTGGAGFIGSHLVYKLTEAGHDVVVLDNLSKGKKEWVGKKAKFFKGDIRDAFDVANAMDGCQAVFHLAANKDVRSGEKDDYEINYLGAKNVFDIAVKKKAKIIFTSSAAVYGNSPLPSKESADCKPISQYGKSKLKAELVALKNGAFVVRMFNVYGPRSGDVVNMFAEKIANYKDLPVYGTGLQTRDFVYIADVVDGLLLGIENTGLYNVGTGTETSLLQLGDLVHKLTKAKPNYVFGKPFENDIFRSRADITKISKMGWAPKVTLEDGIRIILAEIGIKLEELS